MATIREKLAILADAAKYDASCASSGSKRPAQKNGLGSTEGSGICHSYTPDGRCISLLKILLTNHCNYDCVYCVNRVSNDIKRAKFSVDEAVWLTLEFYKRNYIEGLFLSSGIFQSSDKTMDEMIEVARKLRVDHRFNGYIHLKAVAGASPDLVRKAGLYADRISANIELPTQTDLNQLAPAKSHQQVEEVMTKLADGISDSKGEQAGPKRARGPRPKIFAPGGQSTQMIVGATPSSDRTILSTANKLYQTYKLRRVYYSAFSPIPGADARLPAQQPPLVREHRLYQADWLLRFYEFDIDEITPSGTEDLDLQKDPKLAWALRNRSFFPVDVNKAERWQLLRVPGFGVRNVERIISARRFRKLRLEDLKKLRVSVDKVRFFIKAADHNPALRQLEKSNISVFESPKYVQLSLFDAAGSALGGEM